MAKCKLCRAERPFPGQPVGSGWNEDCRSCVAVANGWAARVRMEERIQLRNEIVLFMVYLLSPKFQGIELFCIVCNTLMSPTCAGVDVPFCKNCGGTTYREDRKDFIATADVLRWLDGIEGVLRG